MSTIERHYQLACDALPAYEVDDGPLSAMQLRAIRDVVPQGRSKAVKASLFCSVTSATPGKLPDRN